MIPRYFYRCDACLELAVIEGKQLREVQCDCGGTLRFLGRTTPLGYGLFKVEQRCPCDARCTGATGPNCDCSCGGTNHGTKRLVGVLTSAGAIPRIADRASLEERLARVDLWKAELAAARERINERTGGAYKRYLAGEYIASSTLYWKVEDFRKALNKAASAKTVNGRLNGLRAIAAKSTATN